MLEKELLELIAKWREQATRLDKVSFDANEKATPEAIRECADQLELLLKNHSRKKWNSLKTLIHEGDSDA